MHELNKYILHHLLQNGILKHNDGPDLIKKIAEKLNTGQKSLNQIISEINENITKHLFRIDTKICEISGKKVCVLVNQTLDDISKIPGNITGGEIQLLEKIFHEIMISDAKHISSIVCLNLVSKLVVHLSKDLTQQYVDSWCDNGYLVNDSGTIYLGPRAISEFEPFFKIQYADRITNCQLCTDNVYFGRICSECNEVLHKHCIDKHLTRKKSCPVCKKHWTEAQSRNYDQSDSENDHSMDTD